MQDVRSKGRPSEGSFICTISAKGEAGVVGGVSRVVSSWDSSPPPTTTSNQGSRVGRRKGRSARKVVCNQPGGFASTSPSRGLDVAQDQLRDAQVNAVSRPVGRPSQAGSANDHYGREEQKEEPINKVMSHSCPPNSSSVNFVPLISSPPMFGSSPVAGGMYQHQFNPGAPVFWPRTQGVSCWDPAGQQSSLLPAVWPSPTWLGLDNFLGVGPWPPTPQTGPSFGLAPPSGPSFGLGPLVLWHTGV